MQSVLERKLRKVERNRVYRMRHREKLNEKKRLYYREHRDEICGRVKRYRDSHKEWEKVYNACYYERNKERIIDNIRKWERTELGKLYKCQHQKVLGHNRRAASGDLTIEIIQKVYEDNITKYGRLTCILCAKPIEFGQDSLEHNIPISRIREFPNVSVNSYNNLGIAHNKCNAMKGSKTLIEWFKRKERAVCSNSQGYPLV